MDVKFFDQKNPSQNHKFSRDNLKALIDKLKVEYKFSSDEIIKKEEKDKWSKKLSGIVKKLIDCCKE